MCDSRIKNDILDRTDFAESDVSAPGYGLRKYLLANRTTQGAPGGNDNKFHGIVHGREGKLAMTNEMEETECNRPIQIFFKSMASTVMIFPSELIVETRILVNDIVPEMELRALRTRNNTNTIPATTTQLINTFPNTWGILGDS